MSNSLQSLVPVLNGTNYQSWAPIMKSFLMSQGQWPTVDSDEQPTLTEDRSNAEEVKTWTDANTRAMGNILLRLSESIKEKVKSKTTAHQIWTVLETSYGKPGIAAVYSEFKAVLDTHIPSNAHPAVALDKIQAHFERLTAAECKFPSYVQAMILLSKLPPSMDAIAQIIGQSESVKELKVDMIQRAVVLNWEQRNGRKTSGGNGGSSANKLSAIKRKQPDPSFQQQQQRQNGSSSAQDKGKGKPGRRGNRGAGRNNKKEHRNGGDNSGGHGHAHIVSQALFDGPTVANTPSAEDPRALLRKPVTVPTGDNKYPNFTRALELTKELDITPRYEGIRTLEHVLNVASGSILNVASGSGARIEEVNDSDTESRASKRSRPSLEERLGWTDDEDAEDAVSLGDDVDEEIAEAAGFYEQYRQVPYSSCYSDITNALPTAACSDRPDYVDLRDPVIVACTANICCHALHYAACASCKGKGKVTSQSAQSSTEYPVWLLDSGASMHFTYSLDDFMEYTQLEEPIPVSTANSSTMVMGFGTIILNCPDATGQSTVRITPVFYIPDLTSRLLSLGEFLRNGLSVRGDSQHISLHFRSGKIFMVFYPQYTVSNRFLSRMR